MKPISILIILLASQVSFAQLVKEKRIKQEMIDRADQLISKVQGAREDLDKEDVVSACEKIKEMFIIYPDHLMGIGSYMDIYKNKSHKAKDSALNELMFIHQQKNICEQGENSECVDAKKLDKKLKKVQTSLKKQRKIIKKMDTSHQNSFEYFYEFNSDL